MSVPPRDPDAQQDAELKALREDFERWDWNDLRSEGFFSFVVYRRMVQYGIPIGILGFLLLAWIQGVPIVDVLDGTKPGLAFLIRRFLISLVVTMLVAGVFALWEWRSREGPRPRRAPR